jgi:hypothetical protein
MKGLFLRTAKELRKYFYLWAEDSPQGESKSKPPCGILLLSSCKQSLLAELAVSGTDCANIKTLC